MIKETLISTIKQLLSVIEIMDNETFSQRCDLMGGSSLGMHVRHIYEFIDCALSGEQSGIINYDARIRDIDIQENRTYAHTLLNRAIDRIHKSEANEKCTLIGNYTDDSHLQFSIDTTIKRELAYNIEHAVHHMAIIKMACKQLFPSLEIQQEFGVAHSTLAHQHAQS